VIGRPEARVDDDAVAVADAAERAAHGSEQIDEGPAGSEASKARGGETMGGKEQGRGNHGMAGDVALQHRPPPVRACRTAPVGLPADAVSVQAPGARRLDADPAVDHPRRVDRIGSTAGSGGRPAVADAELPECQGHSISSPTTKPSLSDAWPWVQVSSVTWSDRPRAGTRRAPAALARSTRTGTSTSTSMASHRGSQVGAAVFVHAVSARAFQLNACRSCPSARPANAAIPPTRARLTLASRLAP
jgi:hypothetical protein